MPVLRYQDGGTWQDLPAAGQRGRPGRAGAVGPVGPTGPVADTSHLALVAGDVMTGPLSFALDPAAPMEAVPKGYVDAGGTPGSSAVGYIADVAIPTGVSTFPTPIITNASGLTVSGRDVMFNRSGYYLVSFICQWSVTIPYGIRSFCGILQTSNAVSTSMARSSFGADSNFASSTGILWAAAGDSVAFVCFQATGADNMFVSLPTNFSIRFLGENH